MLACRQHFVSITNKKKKRLPTYKENIKENAFNLFFFHLNFYLDFVKQFSFRPYGQANIQDNSFVLRMQTKLSFIFIDFKPTLPYCGN